MATKTEITLQSGQIVNGYKFNDNLGLFLNEETNLWQPCHLPSGNLVCIPDGLFRRKRSALRFIEGVADLRWDADSEENHYEMNGGFDTLVEVYSKAVKEAEELE